MERTLLVCLALTSMVSACTSYEYEEEVFLEVDGSGRLRVSGSSEILEAMHPLEEGSVSSMRERFQGDGFTIDSVRATERGGRTFVHVQGQFADWNALCGHPAYRERDCRLKETDDGELELHLTLPSPRGNIPEGIPVDTNLAIRFHFPSRVRFHNSSAGIERGNIIGWKRPVLDHFAAAELVINARFERRSVLATTVVTLGVAIAAVLLTVALAVYIMVRKGRKQLAQESTEASRSMEERTPTVQPR